MGTDATQQPWVIVSTGFHERGGQDRANAALAEYLARRDYPVHIVSHSVDKRLQEFGSVQVHIVPQPPGPFFVAETLLGRLGRQVARQVSAGFAQARIVVNGGNCVWPGINWAHYVHHAWDPRVADAPVWYKLKTTINHEIALHREKAAYRVARLVLTNSDLTTNHLVDLLGLDANRVKTIYLGCESGWESVTPEERARGRSLFGLDVDRPTAVFLAGIGFDHRKGFDLAFEAWRQLCEQPDWDVDLVVAGGGAAVPMWKSKIEQTPILAGRIRFVGFSERVRELLALADILISPVRYEAYGLNVQEAICRGIPAIVSSSAGSAERYDEDCAPLLMTQPNTAELLRVLRRWRAEMHCWSVRFRDFGDRLRSYSWQEMAKSMVECIDENV